MTRNFRHVVWYQGLKSASVDLECGGPDGDLPPSSSANNNKDGGTATATATLGCMRSESARSSCLWAQRLETGEHHTWSASSLLPFSSALPLVNANRR